MVNFIKVMFVSLMTFFILSLCMSIFSPLINGTFNDLVDGAIGTNAALSAANGHHATSYYTQLYSAKLLVVAIFNATPYIVSIMTLAYMVLSSLRREDDMGAY